LIAVAGVPSPADSQNASAELVQSTAMSTTWASSEAILMCSAHAGSTAGAPELSTGHQSRMVDLGTSIRPWPFGFARTR